MSGTNDKFKPSTKSHGEQADLMVAARVFGEIGDRKRELAAFLECSVNEVIDIGVPMAVPNVDLVLSHKYFVVGTSIVAPQGESRSVHWFAKFIRESAPLTQLLGTESAREVLAWKCGLFDAIRHVIDVPVVCAGTREGYSWVWMINVADALDHLRGNEESFSDMYQVVTALAQFHHLSIRDHNLLTRPWLVPVERRAVLFSSNLVAMLDDGNGQSGSTASEREWPWLPAALRMLFDALPQHYRTWYVAALRCSNEVGVELASLPTVLVHNDVHERNVGIIHGDNQAHVVAIDWELLGVGPPTMDLAQLLQLYDWTERWDLRDAVVRQYRRTLSAIRGPYTSEGTWSRAFGLSELAIILGDGIIDVAFECYFSSGSDWRSRSIEVARRRLENAISLGATLLGWR